MLLFKNEELINYLTALQVNKSVYEYVVYDSEVEREFAKKLDEREDIKLFVKLPGWFEIDTPVGKYNPDWAILKHDGRLYLVRETKGTKDFLKLRTSEADKVRCGQRHFEALGVVSRWWSPRTRSDLSPHSRTRPAQPALSTNAAAGRSSDPGSNRQRADPCRFPCIEGDRSLFQRVLRDAVVHRRPELRRQHRVGRGSHSGVSLSGWSYQGRACRRSIASSRPSGLTASRSRPTTES